MINNNKSSLKIKLENVFDKILPFAIAGSILLILVNYITFGNSLILIYDVIIMLCLILLKIFEKRINYYYKILSIIILILINGLVTVYLMGFTTTGILLLIISNFMAIFFLDTIIVSAIIGISILGLIGLSFLVSIDIIPNYIDRINNISSVNVYLLQTLVFSIITVVTAIVLFSIKKNLLNEMINSDDSKEANKTIFKAVAIQNAKIILNEKEIHKLAYYDQLTNLPNRNLFEKIVDDRIDSKVKSGMLFMFDLSNFKRINSVYGSIVGDEILRLIGETLKTNTAKKVYFSRISGNEFGIWFEDYELESIKILYETFTKRFDKLSSSTIKNINIEFHIAYVEYPFHGKDYQQLINRCNIAINYAKKKNVSEFICFENAMEEELLFENKIKSLLEKAIENDDFTIHYQKKYDSRSNTIIGVEALARWYSDSIGGIKPDVFIPIIDKYNMIIPFEELIIKKVLNDYSALTKLYGNIGLAINISPKHILSQGFTEFMKLEILKRNIEPSRITVEITEDVMIEGLDVVKKIMIKLKDFGIKISLDDFGSGYSSLNYLAKLPLDELKIDKTFVDQIENIKVEKLLSSVSELISAYGIQMIVEGVERESQLKKLNSLGCYYIQGYIFSRPEPLEES